MINYISGDKISTHHYYTLTVFYFSLFVSICLSAPPPHPPKKQKTCNYSGFSSLERKPTWTPPRVTLGLWSQDGSSRGCPEQPRRTASAALPRPGGCPSPPSWCPGPPGRRGAGRVGAWPLFRRALPLPAVLSSLSALRAVAVVAPRRTRRLRTQCPCPLRRLAHPTSLSRLCLL